ncbi:MAG: acyl carrier protein [Lachnospiraceae bacterium]|nr:acyl carrier protein [Lachnospiraceae bacterium]MBR0086351.1 acyl carrier protein [Lachnospiraceae bacterium]
MMFEKVKEVLVSQLNLKDADITLDTNIKKDLGADSLDILQLLMSIEEEYGIQIPDDELAGFETVGDVVTYLESVNA